jgi:HEPN domain-containing protein
MTHDVAEWVRVAENDYKIATRLKPFEDEASFMDVCFHSQQAVEKYLKAALVANSLDAPRIHDLSTLLDLILPVHPLWEAWRKAFRQLNLYAVDVRYPDDEVITAEEAENALQIAKRSRDAARKELGL